MTVMLRGKRLQLLCKRNYFFKDEKEKHKMLIVTVFSRVGIQMIFFPLLLCIFKCCKVSEHVISVIV